MWVQTKKNHHKKRLRTRTQKRGGGYLWDSPKEKLIKKTKKELKELIAKKEDINLLDLHSKDEQIRKSTRNKIGRLDIKINEKKYLLEEYKKIPDNIKQKELDELNKYKHIVNIEKNRSFNSIINSPTPTNTPTLNQHEIGRLSQSDSLSSGKTTIRDKKLNELLKEKHMNLYNNPYDQTNKNKTKKNPKLFIHRIFGKKKQYATEDEELKSFFKEYEEEEARKREEEEEAARRKKEEEAKRKKEEGEPNFYDFENFDDFNKAMEEWRKNNE